jgi:hypothetical protein
MGFYYYRLGLIFKAKPRLDLTKVKSIFTLFDETSFYNTAV